MVLVECGIGVFMASFEEDSADIGVAQGRGEVEVRVGKALGARVGVVQEARMGAENAFEEESIACMNRSADPDGRVNPGVGQCGSLGCTGDDDGVVNGAGRGAHMLSVESLGDLEGAEAHG